MDANQRREVNNQTNNGANEKWTPGAKGNTTSGPLDHTYPQGPSQQGAIRGENEMHHTQDLSRMGQQEVAAEDGGRADASPRSHTCPSPSAPFHRHAGDT